ncbi:MAG: excinuclease ABC subunit UvrA [Akkermansia sp.]|nr:excinuclease ABC subunit UvrA [Akkermansia sp.]
MRDGNEQSIRIRGAREHNLRDVDVEIPLGKMTVVTGPSGSGKTSLAMHTLYAEGQRRYMETFSPYVRQFMDRMKKPEVDEIENILPAIAIQQRNSVKTSRSTVGTMTGLNDYWKFVFARLSTGIDPETGNEVRPETADSINEKLEKEWSAETELLVCLEIPLSKKVDTETLKQELVAQGYLRVYVDGEVQRLDESELELKDASGILVVQDRVKMNVDMQKRRIEALETAMRLGGGVVYVVQREQGKWGTIKKYRGDWFPLLEPRPGLFSFNSPLGACPECRGYGRIIAIDYNRCINTELSVADGAIHIFEGEGKVFSECKKDLMRGWRNGSKKVRLDVPWKKLEAWEIRWLMEGEGGDVDELYERGLWYGVKGFFRYLESRTHKMHVRVYLSRFRVYQECPSCHGLRLRPEALQFRLGGKNLPELFRMPMDELLKWVDKYVIPRANEDAGLKHAVEELRSRLAYLNEVGLGYLSSERPTRSLSGGEIERVSLTTCLGASLTDTLFVLDEPTVGLHARDTARLLGAMNRLKMRGNTLVVVEHEEAVMRAADHLIDMGPGSGCAGGKLVYSGKPGDILTVAESSTGAYLSGKRQIKVPTKRQKPKKFLKIRGARRHNLQGLNVDVPLGCFTCLTGVSGSGKSTLAHDVIYLNGLVAKGLVCEEEPAEVTNIQGWDYLEEIVMVDQSPIVRTPRSTPAVYAGVFDEIRALFAETNVAKSRGMKPGFFSFNSGEGRCARCLGMGSEKVEMQFLSDIFVECPLCHGSRYGTEVLAVKRKGKNIADVLTMTINEALLYFAAESGARAKKIVQRLEVLQRVGVGHLAMGQPLNTLSGGENQRLKLAKVLLEQMGGCKGARLLILDEPGTGLHFVDIEVLLEVFKELVQQGHTLLVIEHNPEFIKSADYVIDLGPEGGVGGGQLVACGTPEQIVQGGVGFTAKFLKAPLAGEPMVFVQAEKFADDDIPGGVMALRGARHHNLKNVDLDVKRGQMTVLTGLSGSGKSSLAFDIFFAEGQRRFMDVMSPYARQFTEQMESPDIDRLTGLSPTVAIEQNVSRGGTKSTVGTVTEIWQFIRLLYAKLGQAHCPDCGIPVGKRSEAEVEELVIRTLKENGSLAILAPLVRGRKGHYADLARWAEDKGYREMWIDGRMVNLDGFQPLDRYAIHDIDLVVARLNKQSTIDEIAEAVRYAMEFGEGFLQVLKPGANHPELMGTRLACPQCAQSFPEPEPHTFSYNSPRGWCAMCKGHGVIGTQKKQDDASLSLLEAELKYDKEIEKQLDDEKELRVCPSCKGQRLNAFARAVRVQGIAPGELSALSATTLADVVKTWKFSGSDALIANDVVAEISQRLEFLKRVGLGYLSLDRSATTLSGGETQRIRLASQLGSHLRGVLYVLDEPTIGLHPKDNQLLLGALSELKERGNTLLVVEHDEDTMRCADRIIDMGPGAGVNGGQVVADGSFEELANLPDSVTGMALHQKPKHPYNGKRRKLPAKKEQSAWLLVEGCRLHNLKDVDVAIPKGRFTVITGVSGAGKTSLMTGTIRLVARHFIGDKLTREQRQLWKNASGFESIRMVYGVDQSPIGKTPRSTPATYVGFLNDIRTLFAQTEDARRLGFTRSRFSFNTGQGNCETCKGTGMQKLEMDFLPPCYVPCETCRGERYNAMTLTVRYKGKTIADVLKMDFAEASEFFEPQPRIAEPLKLLAETGLGYLTLGQASNTLSGGEAQRLKLVTELIKGRRVSRNAMLKGRELPSDLYLIEEPSIGLHPHDVRLLIDVLHRLVDQGNTVIVIEHNTEIMAEADYIIDMGPGPGENGGEIVATGTPEQLAKKSSPTAEFIRKELFPE